MENGTESPHGRGTVFVLHEAVTFQARACSLAACDSQPVTFTVGDVDNPVYIAHASGSRGHPG